MRRPAVATSMAMDDARECWVCLERTDSGDAAAAPTGCACRDSAGRAHLSCLISAARHKTRTQSRDVTINSSGLLGN